MAQFGYSAPAGRINKLKGEILAHAIPVEVLGITGMQRQLPKNNGKTVSYRRYLPFGGTTTNKDTINRWVVTAAGHELTEGTTPTADTLVPDDIEVTLKQYGCLYQVTDQVVDTYEDDVPAEMKQQCGERVGLIREMVRYGTLKAGTNIYYSGGTSRATVNSKLTLAVLRKASRNLQANHSQRIRGVLAASPNIATQPIEASYLVFCHSDCEADIRDLAGFVHVSEYGSMKPVNENELGSVENFRFITSPELAPYPNAGATAGSNFVTSGTLADVYPLIIAGKDAWGQVALRGSDAIDPTWIPPGQKDKSDPLGQRGFVGAKFYMNSVILNQGWMAVVETAASQL